MAKVTPVIKCPKCGGEINNSTASCYCGFLFPYTNEQSYKQPDYIYFQKFKIQSNPDEWFKVCPHEAQIAAMEDALKTVRYILSSKPPHDGHLKKITGIGKLIGRLSQAIENYSHEGGHIEFSEPTNRPDSEEDPQ